MADTNSRTTFDAGRQYLGMVYAKALFGAAEKSGETEQVLQDLGQFVGELYDRLPKLEAALGSLRVPLADKERMLENMLGTRSPRVLVNGLKVMARNNRLNCLHEVHQSLRHLIDEARGRVEVELRTAVPVSNQLLEKIRGRLSGMLGCDVVIEATVHPEILGGMVVRVGDKLFDGSVVSQLEQLRTRSLENTEAALRGSLERFAGA